MSPDSIPPSPADEPTDFGFKTIPKAEKTNRVKDLFTRVAGHYDLMNDAMSLGLHRCWKRRFVKKLPLRPHARIIDVAAGTGDISLLIHRLFPYLSLSTDLVDPTESMLHEGRKKAINQGLVKNINWYIGAAEALPCMDNTYDLYTISFGLRNVTDRARALSEAIRVLKPGGHFYCLEFSTMDSPSLQRLYDTYSFQVLPFLGKHIAKDEDAYRYLAESIRRFPHRRALEDEMRHAKFTEVYSESWVEGMVALHYGKKYC